MRVLVGAAARGRPEQYKKEIAAVLPPELRDASFSFDLGDEADDWGAELGSAEAVILTSRGLAPKAIEMAAELRFVQKLGVDVDRVGLDTCRRRGIKVSVLSDAGHVAVAEHCVAMALAGTRNLISTHNAVVRKENPQGLEPIRTTQQKRHVNWLKRPEGDFLLAADLTLGLIGFGEIAREVARRASGLFARLFIPSAHGSAPTLSNSIACPSCNSTIYWQRPTSSASMRRNPTTKSRSSARAS